MNKKETDFKLKAGTKYHILEASEHRTILQECFGDSASRDGPVIAFANCKSGRELGSDDPLYRLEIKDRAHVGVKKIVFRKKGPIMVANPSYRKGWDTAFGGAGGLKN